MQTNSGILCSSVPLVSSTVLLWISCQPSSSSWVRGGICSFYSSPLVYSLFLVNLDSPHRVFEFCIPVEDSMDVIVSFVCSSVSSVLTVPNDVSAILLRLGVAGLKRTWDQKLSSGLLLTFTITLLFQFRFVETEQYWLFILTFFRTCERLVRAMLLGMSNCRPWHSTVSCQLPTVSCHEHPRADHFDRSPLRVKVKVTSTSWLRMGRRCPTPP